MIVILIYEDFNSDVVLEVVGPFYNEAEIVQWKNNRPEYMWRIQTWTLKSPQNKGV